MMPSLDVKKKGWTGCLFCLEQASKLQTDMLFVCETGRFSSFDIITRQWSVRIFLSVKNSGVGNNSIISICACLKMDLITAVQTNDLERVRLLVEQGDDKDQVNNSDGYTPLWWASYLGHFLATQYLVEQGVTLEKVDNNSWTPLIIATIRGHLDVCRYLLEQGADRDKAGNSGRTPLHFAAFYGHLQIAMLLMSYGADLNARDNRGDLPIDMERHEITDEIKQAIRDEPRRRMDEAPGKRATEQDRHPNAATSASAQQEE